MLKISLAAECIQGESVSNPADQTSNLIYLLLMGRGKINYRNTREDKKKK